MSVDEAISRLSKVQFVAMVAFTPGMPVCMWLDEHQALSAPQYESPRTHTPAGTVVLGGSSMNAHPVDSPGGFQMVGRLAVPIYSPEPSLAAFATDPVLLATGDRVVFRSVSRLEYEDIADEVRRGMYEYDIKPGRCIVGADRSLSWTS